MLFHLIMPKSPSLFTISERTADSVFHLTVEAFPLQAGAAFDAWAAKES